MSYVHRIEGDYINQNHTWFFFPFLDILLENISSSILLHYNKYAHIVYNCKPYMNKCDEILEQSDLSIFVNLMWSYEY